MASQSGFAPKQTLGIDLGTTNTVVARNGRVLTVSPGQPTPTLLPSVLAFPPNGGSLVGWPAKGRRIIDPLHTLTSTKRLIGAKWGSHRAKRFAELYPYALVDVGGRAAISTRTGSVDPVAAAARILEAACAASGCDPRAVASVITVPAGFEAQERAATLEAARFMGFPEARIVEEPVATAIAYLARTNARYAAVYDLGGGTFDLAIVECSHYPFRVLAHGGDPYLGGDDVDRALATRVAERVLREHRWDLGSDAETFARLAFHCERAKVTLAEEARVSMDLLAVDPAGPWTSKTIDLTRDELSTIAMDIVRRTFVICDAVLSEAGVATRDIDAVFLAGGSTSLPGLRETVGQYFGKRPRRDIDPMHVVAEGASLGAARPDLGGLLEAEGYAA